MRALRTASLILLSLSLGSLPGCSCGGGGGMGDEDAGGGPDASDLPDAGMTGDGGMAADGGVTGDGGVQTVMSITEIIPSAASRAEDTELTVLGLNLEPDASLILENCDDSAIAYDLSDSVEVAADGASLTAELPADPMRTQGIYTVYVTNPDGESDLLECAFRILSSQPPTVTDVVPATAYAGEPNDGVNSDTVVTISGTGFRSTPNVRWVKTDGTVSYDALNVGFVSETELSTVVPSETLAMEPGEYHVFVINPDLLSGRWEVDGTPGIFTITTQPPPDIVDVDPKDLSTSADQCTQTLTITGNHFDPNATAWYIVPDGTTCAGSITDENGNTLCPLTVDGIPDTQTIEAHFDPCPELGAYPIVVINEDDQKDTFFNVEIRNNSTGHLDATDFDVLPETLNVARFAHGGDFGFDPFGNAYLYVAGGQDDAGAVLESVELSQLDIFGNTGPWRFARQYLGPDSPRALNTLLTPRRGGTLLRVGRSFFMIGGADLATDVADPISALASVERAEILGFDEMPLIQLPSETGGGQLPEGAWYYRITAVGPWGESLGSREVVARNASGTVRVCWDPPIAGNAASYNIYRSLASDGRAQSTALIAVEQSGNCFDDTGEDELTPAPGNLRGSPAAGSNLAAGDHTYRVSAHVEVESDDFETYAGYPVTVEITDADLGDGNAAIELNWDPVPGATGYSLYKIDPDTGEFLLLDTGGLIADTTFTDDGASFHTDELTPREEIGTLPPGSLSLWSDDVPSMNRGREGLDGVVIALDPDTSSGLVGRILVAGGRTENTAGSYLANAESIGIFEDGSLEMGWTDEVTMSGDFIEFTHARAFYALLTTQNREATPFPPEPEEPPCHDFDGDGYAACSCGGEDCDDSDPTIHPGAEEICGDGIDQDCDLGCDGTDLECECDDDEDGDGFISCECGGEDCNDTDDSVYPGAPEICGDGIDQDCDMGCEGGTDAECDCDTDADGDGFISLECGGADCCDTGADTSLGCTDDTAPDVNPDADEICGDGVDNDCDGIEAICRVTPQEPAVRPRRSSTFARATTNTDRTTWSRAGTWASPTTVLASSGTSTEPIYDLAADEPVYAVAVLGDDDFEADGNAGRNDIEACLIDDITGHLACEQWQVQSLTTPKASFAIDAFLYGSPVSFLYPFYGLFSESIDPVSRQVDDASISRFEIEDPANVTGDEILAGTRENANLSESISRAYYKGMRLVSYLYLVAGWTDDGPTDTVERHLQ